MNKILMYCHNGSGNHGCEAIVKSTSDLLISNGIDKINLISSKRSEDIKYGINKYVNVYDELNVPSKRNLLFYLAYFQLKVFNNYKLMNKLSFIYPYKDCGKETVSLSIGGDNYCYGDCDKYIGFHNISKKYNSKTVLWGCSVEPDVLKDKDVLNDLKNFDKIVVRETISYEAMLKNGLKNVVLYPDPAFSLKKDVSFDKLPKKNTVGINISPLIMRYEDGNTILNNYIELIRYVLEETDMNISLIPHVVWEDNDDITILKRVKELFGNNDRITLLEDCNCKQLKMHISKLRFLVAARTHASIAAYSSSVPTLVAGYSVKSKGIAKDIFGEYEHYVVPVQGLKSNYELLNKFKWIVKNESNIQEHLNQFMPVYIEKSIKSIEEIVELF